MSNFHPLKLWVAVARHNFKGQISPFNSKMNSSVHQMYTILCSVYYVQSVYGEYGGKGDGYLKGFTDYTALSD